MGMSSMPRKTADMNLHQSNGLPADIAMAAMSTSARVAWIDRYRFKVGALVPDLAPIDAAALALAAFDNLGGRHTDPIEAAEARALSVPSTSLAWTANVYELVKR